MRKRISALILTALMLLPAPMTAHAANTGSDPIKGSVTFDGGTKLKSDGTTDLSAAMGAMQPGDEIVIEIDVKNTSGQPGHYYMTNKVTKSLETGTEAAGGAYEYVLTYTDSQGEETDLFRSEALGGVGTTPEGREGLKGATSGLEDYIYLETLASGRQGKVTLRVALDGETQGNSYQTTAARLEMDFAVDPVTVTARNVTQTVTGEGGVRTVDDTDPGRTGGGRGTGVVRTSDDTNLTPFYIVAGVSGILLLVLALIGRKERKRQGRGAATLGLCLAMILAAGWPIRAEASDYTYTVRLYPGAKGTIASESVVTAPSHAQKTMGDGCLEITGLKYGDQISFHANVAIGSEPTVNLTPDPVTRTSKYFVQGVRESGNERNDAVYTVTEDKDFVVSYGVQGDMTTYRVNYVDRAGNALLPAQTYIGKIGDFAVVGYRYVEGYQPYAYSLGKTLSANEAENVFDFVYTPLPETTNVNTVILPGQETVIEPEEALPVTEVPPGEPEAEAQPETVPDVVPDAEPETENIPDQPIPEAEPTPPEDFVNLDENPTPLDPGESGLETSMDDLDTPLWGLSTAAWAGIGVCTALALGAGIWFLIVRRKKKETVENDGK